MKIFTALSILLCLTSAGHAQLLPVPGARNPDWVLKSTRNRSAGNPGLQPEDNSSAANGVIHPAEIARAREPMPNISPRSLGPATTMPTVGRTGITRIRNNEYDYYDDTRQLFYYWRSKPGSQAPDSLVTVLSKTNMFYTFRRVKPQPKAAPRAASTPRK